MAYKALGLIEVRGMLGAVLASDAAIKAADVELVGNRRIRGGLTTVELLGDVAAVYAAVEAGVDAVENLNCLISSHVIANLDEQVERMLLKSFQKKEAIEQVEDEDEEKPPIHEAVLEELTPDAPVTVAEVLEEQETALRNLKVVELRSLAYKHQLQALTKKDIKFANKETLIKALLEEGVTTE